MPADIELVDARKKMFSFAKFMQPLYVWNWHHEVLANALDDFRTGKIKRLMVFMPPQHGKSEFTSRLFPSFCFGNNPDEKIILCSYSASLAKSLNRDIQQYIDTNNYSLLFPDTILPDVRDSKYTRTSERFDMVDYKGYLISVGVGGSMTGNRADKLIIDDPHKDREEACSPDLNEKVYTWYKDVAKTRTHNNSGILLIQTRWDTNDLAGRLLQRQEQAIKDGDEDADRWTVICFPAIKENNDNPQDPRQVGDALWPAWHNLRRLNDIRGESLRTFQSLYQQNPTPVQAGGECYRSFDYNRNTGHHNYDPTLPLHLSFDFNVNPYMSCTVWQIQNNVILSPAEGSSNTQPHSPLSTSPSPAERAGVRPLLLEEICLRSPHNTTTATCDYINTKYTHRHQSTTYIYGDPSGMKEDTRSEAGYNDFVIIKQELAALRPVLRISKKAPSVYMRISFMNALFAGTIKGLSISLDRKCQNTINDFLYIKEESNGTKQKTRSTDPVTGIVCEKYGHLSDATEYFICLAFHDHYTKFCNRGSSTITVVRHQPHENIRRNNRWYY